MILDYKIQNRMDDIVETETIQDDVFRSNQQQALHPPPWSHSRKGNSSVTAISFSDEGSLRARDRHSATQNLFASITMA